MLKIKDNVNIKELEKYGFTPKYDENTGEIIAYEKCEREIYGIRVTVIKTKSYIRIFNKYKNKWYINPCNNYFDVDLLYDLIQAGLVEKVKEN